MIVAIDGPAGSGKSTVARLIARDRGFTYLDTGAMYRSVAYLALQRGVDLSDEEAVTAIACAEPVSFGRTDGGGQSVSVAGQDVTQAIRTPEVDASVSRVASIPGVRHEMVRQQRALSGEGDVVAEGRDIGTVVFPQAQVKVFLTASPQTRAHRRADQRRANACAAGQQGPVAQGQDAQAIDEQAVLEAILRRDEADSSRAESPLRPAEDAVHIDSSCAGIDEVVGQIGALIDVARAAQQTQPEA